MFTAIVRYLRSAMSPKCSQGKHQECTLFTASCACWCHGS